MNRPDAKQTELVTDWALMTGDHEDAAKGETYRSLLLDCESIGGVVVFWGCWTDAELEAVVG